MIRVIVVDDEKVIQEGIGRFVKETDGFELLATCADGEAAYDKIQELHPDLVICDIIMPVCDGIELIKRCRGVGIESEFVLLSGYSEFEYAQAAIRYGVLDYINKPVNRAALKKLLENVRRVVEKKSGVKKQLQSNAYEKVIEEGSGELGRNAEKFFSEDLSHRVLVINCTGGSKGENARNATEDAVAFCESLMKNEAYEEYIAYSRKGLAVLILMGMDAREHNVEKICDKIQTNAMGRGYPVYIGVGDMAKHMGEIPLSYKRARAAMYEAQRREKRVCFADSLSYSYVSPVKTYAMDISDVIHAFHLGDMELANREAKRLTEQYEKTAPPYVIFAFIQKCAQELLEYLGEFVERDLLGVKAAQLTDLVTAADTETLLVRFEEFTRTVYDIFRDKEKRSKHGGTIGEVVKYIHLHYTGDISIEKICSVFYFNQSYFSALFKTKTGSNYNDYVTELRMKKAKELLRSGKYRVNEIAGRVGYNSSRYFSKVFKSRTGELPQEYKNRFSPGK